MRAKDSRRRGGGLNATLAAELRRLMPAKEARAILANLPKLGVESLEAVHHETWAVLADLKVRYRAFCQAVKDCDPTLEDMGAVEFEKTVLRASHDTAGATKRVCDVLVSINRLYLDRELDAATGDITVGVDAWNEDVLNALVTVKETDSAVH
jgi:hypothetical protein